MATSSAGVFVTDSLSQRHYDAHVTVHSIFERLRYAVAP